MLWKRPFDLFCASVLSIVLLPLFAYVAWQIRREGDGPILYISERMQTPQRGFGLFKFRTMEDRPGDAGVTGGNKDTRITKVGARLRRSRLDELPQLWNIVLGHMSFVGPRPPLREYVERFPDTYGQVLRSKPGVTGLASLVYSRHEVKLLERCTTAEQTDHVYVTQCIPAKAKLDLIYQRHRGFCFDLRIIYQTLHQAFSGR